MAAGRIGSAELEDLVGRRAELDATYLSSSLPRLSELSANAEGADDSGAATLELHAKFAFLPGAEGFPQLRLNVSGCVPLVCQRCLKVMRWPVQLDVLLTVIGADADPGGLVDPFETVQASAEGLSLAKIVEDEVLVALPLSAKHEDMALCRPMAPIVDDEPIVGETHRPMAGLAALLDKNRQGNE